MSHLLYLGVLGACLVVTLPLEVVLRARVYARWRRLLLTLAPVLVVFTGWDAYAISRHHWSYARHWTTGLRLGSVPVEELAFFLVVPVCATLTYEAVALVRARR